MQQEKVNCCLKYWRGSAPLPSPGGKVPQCAHWGGRGTARSGTTFARKQDKSCPNTVLYHALHQKFSDIADPHQSRFARQLPPGGSQGASRKDLFKQQFSGQRMGADGLYFDRSSVYPGGFPDCQLSIQKESPSGLSQGGQHRFGLLAHAGGDPGGEHNTQHLLDAAPCAGDGLAVIRQGQIQSLLPALGVVQLPGLRR